MGASIQCRVSPTYSPEWVTAEVRTGGAYPLLLCAPSADVTTVPASDIETGLIASLLALGHRPSVGTQDLLAVEVGEVGARHALVRVRTSAGAVVVRVPLGAVVHAPA